MHTLTTQVYMDAVLVKVMLSAVPDMPQNLRDLPEKSFFFPHSCETSLTVL